MPAMPTLPRSPSLSRLSGPSALAVLMVAVLACGCIDYITGYEVSVFALYLLPIGLGVRLFGTWGGSVVAVACAIAWLVADQLAGHRYGQPWFGYWNALHRLFLFLCVVVGIRYARIAMATGGRLGAEVEKPLPLCTQCHRVGAENGHWQRLESYLGERVGAQPLRKVCPDCAREAYAKAGMAEHTSHR